MMTSNLCVKENQKMDNVVRTRKWRLSREIKDFEEESVSDFFAVSGFSPHCSLYHFNRSYDITICHECWTPLSDEDKSFWIDVKHVRAPNSGLFIPVHQQSEQTKLDRSLI